MKTILVPVDFSPATSQLCDAAGQLARSMKARIQLLHVVQTPPFVVNDYYGFDTGTMAGIVAIGEKTALRQLQALRRRCRKKGMQAGAVQISGAPVPVILKEAQRRKAAYIVMGSHGHGAVFDLLVGSTTHGVLRKSSCPVLVVPTIRR